jgi:hypothetical protein
LALVQEEMVMTTGRPWTSEETATARAMKRAGATDAQIAVKLDRTMQAINNHFRRQRDGSSRTARATNGRRVRSDSKAVTKEPVHEDYWKKAVKGDEAFQKALTAAGVPRKTNTEPAGTFPRPLRGETYLPTKSSLEGF